MDIFAPIVNSVNQLINRFLDPWRNLFGSLIPGFTSGPRGGIN